MKINREDVARWIVAEVAEKMVTQADHSDKRRNFLIGWEVYSLAHEAIAILDGMSTPKSDSQ
jgi:hypothetical protein